MGDEPLGLEGGIEVAARPAVKSVATRVADWRTHQAERRARDAVSSLPRFAFDRVLHWVAFTICSIAVLALGDGSYWMLPLGVVWAAGTVVLLGDISYRRRVRGRLR